METRLTIKIVGDYPKSQGKPEDCNICENADWGDVVVEGICGKCLLECREKTLQIVIQTMEILSKKKEGKDGRNNDKTKGE